MMAVLTLARSLSMVTVLALAASALAAQEAGQGTADTVIIRALAKGEPVTDLTPADLTVRIDGRAREVKSLQLVSAADADGRKEAAATASSPRVSSLPSPYHTNQASAQTVAPSGGREFLLIVDEDGIAPGQEEPVKKAIGRFLSEATESDRFGYLSLRLGGANIAPSTGRGAVTDAVAKLVGYGSNSENTVDFTCRTKRSMNMLTAGFETAPAGRTLVLITSGLAANPAAVQAVRSRVNAAGDFDNSIPETCQIRSNDLENFGAAAAISPANLYVVHYPGGMAAPDNLQAGQSGIENLTGVSGAEFVRLVGGDETALGRIVQETSAYYIATLDGAPSGPMRRVDARVKRDGVKIVARPTVRSADARSAAGGRGGRSGGGATKATPRDMIRVATPFSDLPLRAAGFVSRQPNSKDLKVMALFEPDGEEAKLSAAVVALFNEKGELKAQWTAQSAELQRSPVVAALTVAPGKYRMRVAATDAQGRAGATDVPIDVELATSGPVSTGTLMLSADQNSPRLLFYSTDQAVIGFLQVYGVPPGTTLTATYEVRESEAGEPLGATDGNVLEVPNEPDARLIWGGFGLPPLEPGDYLMRVVVKVDGKEVATPTRTLRKTK